MNLIELYNINNYNTDKGETHSYIKKYNELFNDMKEKNINLLELGIAFGGSIKLWKDYFIFGNIYGIDIRSNKTHQNRIDNDLFKNNRVKFDFFDCTNIKIVNSKYKNNFFDIIIDDASHNVDDQLKSLVSFEPKLKKNGLYIIEDIGGGRKKSFHLRGWNYSKTISKGILNPLKYVSINQWKEAMKYDEKTRYNKLLNFSDNCRKEIIDFILKKYNSKFEIEVYDNRINSKKTDDTLIILKKIE